MQHAYSNQNVVDNQNSWKGIFNYLLMTEVTPKNSEKQIYTE